MDKIKPTSLKDSGTFFTEMVGRQVEVKFNCADERGRLISTVGKVLNVTANLLFIAHGSNVELIYLNSVASISPTGADSWDFS